MFKKITVILLVICLISAAGYLFSRYQRDQQILYQRKAEWSRLEAEVKKDVARFNQECGIVIKDLKYGWEIEVNQDKLFPSASMVKIPIMASIVVASRQGKLKLGDTVVLKNKDKAYGSGVLKEYASGSRFNIDDLVELMITQSDNTAANMLIDYMGLDNLNGYFKKMGLSDTNLARKMMDFKSRDEGIENFTSARDLANLLEKIYCRKLAGRQSSQICLGILKKQKIRDRIPRRLPSGTIVANKTGLERNICHDAGIVFTPQGDFLICVLTRHQYQYARPAKIFISRLAREVYNCYR